MAPKPFKRVATESHEGNYRLRSELRQQQGQREQTQSSWRRSAKRPLRAERLKAKAAGAAKQTSCRHCSRQVSTTDCKLTRSLAERSACKVKGQVVPVSLTPGSTWAAPLSLQWPRISVRTTRDTRWRNSAASCCLKGSSQPWQKVLKVKCCHSCGCGLLTSCKRQVRAGGLRTSPNLAWRVRIMCNHA